MKKLGLIAILAVLLTAPSTFEAQNAAKPPAPEAWLKQLEGEWEAESEMSAGPGTPAMKAKVTEKARTVGIWMIWENDIKAEGFTITGIMTVGYDPEKKKFIGTWIDSMQTYLWKYEGTLDPTGKILTLEAEGPSMATPGKMAKYRDIIEIKNKDHKVFRSAIQGEDGKWTTFLTSQSRRKK